MSYLLLIEYYIGDIFFYENVPWNVRPVIPDISGKVTHNVIMLRRFSMEGSDVAIFFGAGGK